MSESLRNDGRIWVPLKKGDKRRPIDIPEEERDYYLERRYPAFGNLVPRDVASRAAKERCDAGYGVGSTGLAVFLDFEDSIKRLGKEVVASRYGNLFEMYQKITGEDPYKMPMRIFPAVHYTMGGLWVDYDLMTTVPGLYAIGECNFSDHGANRLGASALMQGLADGYFVLPYTIGKYLSDDIRTPAISTEDEQFEKAEKEAKNRVNKLLNNNGNRSVESFHRELGKVVWDHCGMSRNKNDLEKAIETIKDLKAEFWTNVSVPGEENVINPELAKAGRVADFIELGELMMRDALARDESCGGHFREEHQTDEGEALTDDTNFAFTSAWEFSGETTPSKLNKETLEFENVQLTQRSYK